MIKYVHLGLVAILVFCIVAVLNAGIEEPGLMYTSQERMSPADRIDESKIGIYDDRVVIQVENPSWASFMDTNSMDPFLDYGANSIEIVPSGPEDVQVGDVVSYHYGGSIIVHRVVLVGEDEEGVFYLMKGDNNSQIDPEKIRFEQINGVLVAVIY